MQRKTAHLRLVATEAGEERAREDEERMLNSYRVIVGDTANV